MIGQQQIEDALADFNGLIADGWEADSALEEAANSNGMPPENLRKRLTHSKPLEDIVSEIRARANADMLRRAIIIETKNYWANIPKNRGLGVIFNESFKLSKIRPAVEDRIGRTLSDQECDKINDQFFQIINGQIS